MCNLYRIRKTPDEIASLFGVVAEASNAPGDVYPGYPGLVIAEGRLRSMVWGFPLMRKSKKTGQLLKPKPVNNTRADKLESFMWRYSFAERRCLIPIEAFAEAEGVKGSMTRTWISLPDQSVMACAGIWRDSDEWGPVYSMMMTEASITMEGIHDRMPVILVPDQHEQWLAGSTDDALALCQPYPGILTIDRTNVPWVKR